MKTGLLWDRSKMGLSVFQEASEKTIALWDQSSTEGRRLLAIRTAIGLTIERLGKH